MAIERWRYTKRQILEMEGKAFQKCPTVRIEDLKVGDRVLGEGNKGLIVTEILDGKPVFAKLRTGDIVDYVRDTYRLISDDLMQFAIDGVTGVSQRVSVIEAVLLGKPVPKEVLIEFKSEISVELNWLKSLVLSRFNQLIVGHPPLVSPYVLWANGKDYNKLVSHSSFDLWLSLLDEKYCKEVIELKGWIEFYEKFLKTFCSF